MTDIIYNKPMCRSALGLIKPPIQLVPGALPRGVKRPAREADSSPPSSAEVKKGGAMPPLLDAFMAWCLIKKSQGYLYFL
jgi:hypothetical protein